MKLSYIKIVLFAFVSILMLNACAGKKKKGEISKRKMFYHNLTSKYNGYFNADELMFFSEAALSETHVDNYNQILDVYDFVDIENPKAVAQDLDKAIEKVGTVASLHRPSHWLDDCYVLMGKAQYLKHDYETAQETFEYFQEEFNPRNPFGSNFHSRKKSKREKKRMKDAERKHKEELKEEKNKKKEEERKLKKKKRKKKKKSKKRRKRRLTKKEKEEIAANEKFESKKEEAKKLSIEDDKYADENEKARKAKQDQKAKKPKFYEHKPIYNEGLLWLAKTYIAREKWSSAKSILRKIEQSVYYKPDDLEKEIAITTADLYIKQKQYDEAIPFLEAAAQLADKKKNEARYRYILAQIYDRKEDYLHALNNYKAVSKLHPNYEMSFNADLNGFKTELLSGTRSKSQVVSNLEKMLKEDKNIDFRDQLFFTLGRLELQEPNIPAAIQYFEKSVKANTSNEIQKAESYYVLADIYYNMEDYYRASMYYDSTQSTMDKKDERFYNVNKYANNLKDIARNISIIRLQDSLLSISNLPKEELEVYAKDLIEKERELKKKLNKSDEAKPDGLKHVVNSTKFGSKPSTFFAYHPQQVIIGIQQFTDNWGDRSLEDNWRRSNKFGGSADEESEESEEEDGEISDAEITRALKDIPISIGDKMKANEKIEEALYNLGVQYRERLDNCEKSSIVLERLLRDFPETKYKVEASYVLYVCNLNSNPILSNSYANIITTEFPDSKYAKFLSDPNFAQDFLSDDKKAGRYYDLTYTLFKNNDFVSVRTNAAQVDSLFDSKNKYRPKFALLDAMAQGHIESKEAYIGALKTVVKKYPNTREKTRAQEILRFLKGDKYTFGAGLSEEELEKFTLQDNRMHYVIVKITEGADDFTSDELKISISRFNKKYFKLDKLKTKDSYLDIKTKTSLILIRRFSNKDKALVYYDTVLKNKNDFLDENVDYEIFAITQRNYREVLKQKTTDNYKLFFEQNYFKK